MEQDYLPFTLRMDRDGVEWVLKNYHVLSSGDWPGSRPSGYTEMPWIQRGIFHATFENSCLVAAEVLIRVKRCGLDGFLVEERYVGKETQGVFILKSEEDIAKERYLPVDYICRRINKVIWYCASGWTPRWIDTRKRRGLTYEEWKRYKSYRKFPHSDKET